MSTLVVVLAGAGWLALFGAGTWAWLRIRDRRIRHRLRRVNAVEERISHEINTTLLGTTQTILVEGVSKKGQHYGRTRTGKLVHLDAPARTGALVDVHIDHAGPFALRGSAVDALAVV